jgi:hypothetical protein
LTIKTDGLWKTIKVWCDHGQKPGDRFILATCAALTADNLLNELTTVGNARSDALVKLFDDEAIRVHDARATPVLTGTSKQFATRSPGCAAWLSLNPSQRQSLLKSMRLVPAVSTAADIPGDIAGKLKTCVVADVRLRVVERLLEWWDRQVLLSMIGKRDRRLSKAELLNQIERLIIEHSSRGLPDDVAGLVPEDIDAEMIGVMARQIKLVSGGRERIQRAAIARWRVRTQREKWLSDDLSVAVELDRFDIGLVERWKDRFGPMQHDCSSAEDSKCCQHGLQLLDWSHHYAPREAQPIRPLFTAEYLVQGTYQQLADEKRVGWHPRYSDLLSAQDEDDR